MPCEEVKPQTATTATATPTAREVVQFNVFLDNRVGRFLHLLECFDRQPVTIAAFSIIEATGHSVVRLVTNQSDLTRKLLSQFEYPFAEEHVLAISLRTQASLALICDNLSQQQINIQYIHSLLVHPLGLPAVILQTQHNASAIRILQDNGIALLTQQQLTNPTT